MSAWRKRPWILITMLLFLVVAISAAMQEPPADPEQTAQPVVLPDQPPEAEDAANTAGDASAQERDAQAQRAEAVVRKVFGVARNDDSSGVATVIHTPWPDRVTQIVYRYFPVGIGPLRSELAISMSKKLRMLYSSSDSFDQVRINVQLPFSDIYGQRSWNKGALIVFKRSTYEKINWDNFDAENLWRVADEAILEKNVDWN